MRTYVLMQEGSFVLEHASGQFTIDGQVEDILGGSDGAARLARISQTCCFSGAFEGESIAEYSAVLPRDAAGSFQGFQRITGALGERAGSFVVRVQGEYTRGQARGVWEIVPKSGSGDFVHIRGAGSFSQSPGKPGSYTLEFDLRKPRKSRAAVDVPASQVLAATTKRGRKQAAPVEPAVSQAEPVVSDIPKPKPKQTRKQKETAEPSPERTAKTASAPAPPATRKRTRQTVATDTPAPAVADSAPPSAPKPARRKKAASAPPVDLPATPAKPSRQRKAIAA